MCDLNYTFTIFITHKKQINFLGDKLYHQMWPLYIEGTAICSFAAVLFQDLHQNAFRARYLRYDALYSKK